MFCKVCGTKMVKVENKCTCSKCGNVQYVK